MPGLLRDQINRPTGHVAAGLTAFPSNVRHGSEVTWTFSASAATVRQTDVPEQRVVNCSGFCVETCLNVLVEVVGGLADRLAPARTCRPAGTST